MPEALLMSSNPSSATAHHLLTWAGAPVRDPDGRRCGTVVQPVVDRETGTPTWLLLRSREGFRCLPLTGLVGAPTGVHTVYPAGRVRSSCPVDSTGALSARQEAQLCVEYDLPLTEGATRASWERRRTTAGAMLLPDGTLTWEPRPRGATAQDPSKTGLGLLIVHPDTATRDALTATTRRLPGRVRLCAAVSNGPHALRTARTDPPDIAVIALELPLLDGPTTAARLRQTTPNLVVALLTPDDTTTEQIDPTTLSAPDHLAPGTLIGLLERTYYRAADHDAQP